MAALHAHWRDPQQKILLVSKGMLGKSGCTRMVQGGFNAVLNSADSIEAHFEDASLKENGDQHEVVIIRIDRSKTDAEKMHDTITNVIGISVQYDTDGSGPATV